MERQNKSGWEWVGIACYTDRMENRRKGGDGVLLTPAAEKNELEGSPEPSKRSSVSNYRHTHPGQDRQKNQNAPKGRHQDRETRPSNRGGQRKDSTHTHPHRDSSQGV